MAVALRSAVVDAIHLALAIQAESEGGKSDSKKIMYCSFLLLILHFTYFLYLYAFLIETYISPINPIYNIYMVLEIRFLV